MKKKILVSTIASFVVAYAFGPPDILTHLVLAGMAALLCAATLLVLGRCASVRGASPAVHALIIALVFLISVLLVYCYQLRLLMMSHRGG